MPDPKTQLQERLQAFRKAYIVRLPDKLAALRETWGRARSAGCDSEEFKDLHRMTHGLTGSGASFGLVEVSDVARRLEQLAKSLIERGGELGDEQDRQIELLIDALEAAPANEEPVVEARKQDRDQPSRYSRLTEGDARTVFVVEDDSLLAEQIATRLVRRGYQARVFDKLQGLRDAIVETCPAAIVMDMVFPEGAHVGAEVLMGIRNTLQRDVPILFISGRDDIETRLQAVRTGSAHYFNKPLDIDKLGDTLDELTTGEPKDPYRILVVDDDQSLANFFGFSLRHAGMSVTTVNDPLEALDVMQEFRPELILMDIYMPGCSGVELATIIRQQERFSGVAIVFLSTEASFDRQLAAMNMGATTTSLSLSTPAT